MEPMRILIGLLCVPAGMVLPCALYTLGKGRTSPHPALLAGMAVAAATSFLVFTACRALPPGARRGVIGAAASYGAFLVLLSAAASAQGTMAETLMWMPVIVLVGIPYMAPLVAMTWLGSVLVFGKTPGGLQAGPPAGDSHPRPRAQ